MSDDTKDQDQPESADSGTSSGALGAVRSTFRKRDSKGRPLGVYVILGIGVATLLILMLVVYFWSADRDRQEQPICTSITPARAQDGVREGDVERLIVAFDEEVKTPTSQAWGPVLAQVDYVDGKCGILPQGIANQSDILAIVGAITFYNQTTDSAQVEIVYNPATGLDDALFVVTTEAPSETPPPSETPVSTPVATPTATESATEVPAVTPASPAASPAGTPAAPTPEPTATP